MVKSFSFWAKTIITAGTLYAVSQITEIYLPVILAVVFAFVLTPVVTFLCKINLPFGKRNLKVSRGLAVLISFLFAGLFLSLAAAFILVPFVEEFNKFARDLPNLLKHVHSAVIFLSEYFENLQMPSHVRTTITQTITDNALYAVSVGSHIINDILLFAGKALVLLIVPILTYYFLKDWRQLKDGAISPLSAPLRTKADAVIKEMGLVISGYIRGQLLICMVMGLLVFCGLYFLGIPYPLVLGLLAALTETIPILGPIIGAIPAILLALTVSHSLALKVVLFYIFLNLFENQIIIPKIMGHIINLHPAVIILSLLIGGHLGGIAGMIVAVPVTALLQVLLKHIWFYE